MPVIWHEAIGQNAHKNFGMSFCQDLFEPGIVSGIIENPIPGISTVEYVTDHSAQCVACCSWQDGNIPTERDLSIMIWTYPFFFNPKQQRKAVSTSVVRGRPFGSGSWQEVTAKQLGIESTFRPRGRPKMAIDDSKSYVIGLISVSFLQRQST
jgi:hypothetical protein